VFAAAFSTLVTWRRWRGENPGGGLATRLVGFPNRDAAD
jgi:hypothetical protein